MPPTAWERVVGQDEAVALLQRAADRPSHAYLLVGPRGSGVEEAARCFAAAADRARRRRAAFDLALRGVHPDVVEIDPAATQIRVEDAQAILDEAYRSPIEGDRKAILVFEAERLNEQAANKLLKTLEEPPETALIVLVTAGADQLLATIRSRCQRVDFAYRGAAARARRRQVARGAPTRSSGRSACTHRRQPAAGVTAAGARCVAEDDAMQAAVSQLEAGAGRGGRGAHRTSSSATGYPDRVVRTQLRRLAERQKRAHRHARTELLVEGITALETVYRDALAGPGRPAPQRRPGSPAAARGPLVQPRARRLPRRPPGPRRVQPQRDPAARAAVPPPARRAALVDHREGGRRVHTARRGGPAPPRRRA